MTVHLQHLTWEEAGEAAAANRLVIIPTGATEAHGAHLPLDVDTHQVSTVAERLAERVGALVAPALPYGYSTTWMGYPGTMTLSSETYQQVIVELASSLVEHGFHRIVILNEGRIVADGSFEQLQSRGKEASLERIFTQLTSEGGHAELADEFIAVFEDHEADRG